MEEDEGDASAFHEIMGGGYSTSEEEEREEQEEENSEGEETEGRKGKKRTFISLRVKRRILLAIDSAKKEGMSQKKACQLHQIQPSQYRRWKKVEEEMKVASNQKAVTLHTGKASSIVDIEEDLLEWFWGIREKGMSVSHKMLQIEASKRCNVFRRKTEWSKVKTIERYVRKNDLVMRSTTRKSQATPESIWTSRSHQVGNKLQSGVVLHGTSLPQTFVGMLGDTTCILGSLMVVPLVLQILIQQKH